MRAGFSIVGLVAALLIVGVTVLAVTSRQPQHSRAAATPAAPVAAADVRAAFVAGLTCVKAGDQAGWQQRLPAGGAAAQRVLAELYQHLAPLRWTALRRRRDRYPRQARRLRRQDHRQHRRRRPEPTAWWLSACWWCAGWTIA